MGSHVWVRDDKKKNGGKTYAAGVAAVVQPPPVKKQRVWQRDANAIPVPKPPASIVQKIDTTNQADSEKLHQVEDLKKKIEEKRKALQRAQSIAANSKDQLQREEEEERRLKKEKLEAGFSEAFAKAKENAAIEIAASKTALRFADEAEVNRVLKAHSDYGVLKLHPGVDAAAMRKRYKELAITLHPDKCPSSKAAEAFQRLVKAYQNLSKYIK